MLQTQYFLNVEHLHVKYAFSYKTQTLITEIQLQIPQIF